MIVLALVTGLLCGFAAGILKNIIHFLHTSLISGETPFIYFAFPALGMLITVLIVKYMVKDNISHGVTRVLYAISRKESKLPKHSMWTSVVASAVTIGFGGSVGAEAPIVLTGSAIGSNIGRKMKLNYKSITLLLACGAAGAVSGIFKAPIAGVIFTLEVLMIDITLTSVAPLLISSVAATCVSYLMVGQNMEFGTNALTVFSLGNSPYYIVLGIFCGLLGLYFIRTTFFIESRFARLRRPLYKVLIGGVLLGLTIFLFPPLYGEGYEIITSLLNGSEQVLQHSWLPALTSQQGTLLVYLLLLLVFKVIAMAATNGGGGVGGTFGPTLFMGGIGGFFVAKLINAFTNANLPVANFTLVGMAGLMAAVMHSPLTAIFLIAEITGGYTLFVPLIITSATAFVVINYFEPYSIYTKRLAKKGDLLTQNKDQAVLTLLKTQDLIETDFSSLLVNGTLGDIVKVVAQTHRNLFPVVDTENKLMGVVLLDDIRTDMFSVSKYNVSRVYDYMQSPPAVVIVNDTMETITRKFEESSAWNLPVVDRQNNYVGFVSKSKILSAYRDMLLKLNQE
ncbi:chloride channel protein [Bacteroidia bacterium]|nr:chloride channel protein [Bacteroidia bacterium]